MAQKHPTATLNERQLAAFSADMRDLRPATRYVTIDDVLADLTALGLAPGDAVIVCMANGVQLVQVHLGAQVIGLVPLAVAPSTPWERVRALAGQVGARAIVTTRIVPELDTGRHRAVGTARAVLTEETSTPYRAGDVLMSTSGTSGPFSACLHRTTSLLRNARRHATAVGMTADDTVLVSLPLHYSYAMVAQVLAAYVVGAGLIITGPPFSPLEYRATTDEHDVTHSAVTPTIVRHLLTDPNFVPTRPRVLTVGGDQLAAEEVAGLLLARPDGELYVTYGLTEAGPRVATLAAHAEPAHRHASVGLPLPGVRTRLRDIDVHGTGELVVESDTALIRRVGDHRPDDERVSPSEPGAITTGDLFHVDGDGYHHFRGRLADFVVLRGEKVSLRTVREVACAIPGVVRCAPTLERADDGTTVLDVHIDATETGPDFESVVRRRLNTMLLPAERPRAVRISASDPAVFRK